MCNGHSSVVRIAREDGSRQRWGVRFVSTQELILCAVPLARGRAIGVNVSKYWKAAMGQSPVLVCVCRQRAALLALVDEHVEQLFTVLRQEGQPKCVDLLAVQHASAK